MSTTPAHHYGLLLKVALVFVLAFSLGWWIYQGASAPLSQRQVCLLFKRNPQWYWAALASERKWGVPVSEQMAIMQKESHFRSTAQPPHRRLLGFIPWQRISSATGYMQALDATWRLYLHDTHQYSASRSDFSKATDFIGWYITRSNHLTGVKKSDVFHNYLIYHEGVGGYRARRYDRKPWLVALAHRVANRAELYHHQLLSCARTLPKKPWWRLG
jgi:hypothetical protein